MYVAPASSVPTTCVAAASIPQTSASNISTDPSSAANPCDPVAALIAVSNSAAALPASEFHETRLSGRIVTDYKALSSSSELFLIYHIAKHLSSFLGHGASVKYGVL